MKKPYSILILLVAICSLNAQTPTYGWAKSIGGSYSDFLTGITVGPDNNPVVIGNFLSLTLNIGDTTFNNYYNYYNSFIIKYDDNGNQLWANQVNGTATGLYDSEVNQGLSTDGNGNLYFTGQYNDSIFFGNNISLPDDTNSTENAYTVKYNSSGSVQWARRVRDAVGEATATGLAGNIAMAGLFFISDTVMPEDTFLTTINPNGEASFIIQYDGSGSRLWQQVLNGVAVNALASDKLGNLYVAGNITDDTAFIGNYTLLNTDPSAYSSDIFLAKYTASGSLLWAEGFGGVQDDVLNAMCISANNEVNITGNYDSPELDFGGTALTNPVGANFTFVARLDSSGNPLWATSAALDNAICITTDADNSIFVSGDYYDTTVVIGTDTLHNSSYENMFIVKYDASGNVDWALTAPGSNDSLSGTLIANDANGNSYIGVNFDNAPLQLGSTLLSPAGELDIAVAKLDNTGAAAGIKTVNTGNIKVYPNPSGGMVYITGLTPGSEIEIYDLLGEEIYSAVTESELQQIHLNATAKGMYIYRVTGNNITGSVGEDYS